MEEFGEKQTAITIMHYHIPFSPLPHPHIFHSSLLSSLQSSSLPSLHTLLSLVVVALISCPDKATYIQPIMSLSPSSQATLKSVIEATMGTVEKVIPERRDSLESEGEEVDFTLDPSEVADLRSQVSQLTGELSRVKNDLEVVRVKDEGRVEEAERHNEKLKGLVEDLQGRLEENEQKVRGSRSEATTDVLERFCSFDGNIPYACDMYDIYASCTTAIGAVIRRQ